ncbi:Transcription elongation regulator [Micromonospora noduli]|uniref:5-oxoprolinase subunit B family protein n=1 Tax=Micromonospora noduli TaxID=709876 RepID=UPI000DC58B49|nr:carboxyltransferase domain-containing protein [Micromonospora noduli]RAO56749.1 Transcription elongation regulator [Micromonospora noduli]
MRIRPVGAHALLLDCTVPANTPEAVVDIPEAAFVEAWRAELWRRRERGDLIAVEIVPAARTVLLDGLPDPTTTAEQLTRWTSAVTAAITRPDQAHAEAHAEAGAKSHAKDHAHAHAHAKDHAHSKAEAQAGADAHAGAGADADAQAQAQAHAQAQDRNATAEDGAEDRADDAPDVVVPVTFDGPDLPAVAEHWGVDVPAVRHRLTSTRFRVAFCGFAPGFPYLTGLPAELALPRLATPRPRVPAGSVALAGPYAGIYPGASPGGWLLVGRTDLVLFDVAADPPARLGPGTTVRMVVA